MKFWKTIATCCCALVMMPAQADDGYHAGYRKLSFEHQGETGSRVTNVLLWYPTHATEAPLTYHEQEGSVAQNAAVAEGSHALILFSHGFRGAADQTIFLMEAFARAGYIVAAPYHGDAMAVRRGPRERPGFADAASWTEAKFMDRREDVQHLLDHLLRMNGDASSFLAGRINPSAVGGAGHSLGGYTMLGLAGAWDSWRDERIRAVLVMSPYAQPFLKAGELAQVSIPIMLQGGTRDVAITPFLTPIYRKLETEKYFLVLLDATHFEWTNLLSSKSTTTECVKNGNAKLIVDYSIAFFDRHLRGAAGGSVLDAKAPGLEYYDHVK